MALNAPPDSLVGQTLGHYRLSERIGQGGMGIVYLACDEHLHRDVAVKILPEGAVADEFSRQRFRKEAHALSKLNHPNIAVVHDFDTQAGIDFLVEEFVPGSSLDTMISSGPLPGHQVIDLGVQLTEGLAAAHGQGIIHRDLKPANVRITPDLRVKILDFGLAKLISGKPVDATVSVTSNTSISGTVPYMAPEQLLKQNLDARTDIWAAGCLLYETACGRRPFVQDSVALIDEILHQPPLPPSRLNPKIPPGLEAIILKCLEKDPGLRYQSTRELTVDLRRLSSFTSTVAIARQPRRIRRRLALLGIGFSAILGGVLGVVIGRTVLVPPSGTIHVTIPSDTAQVCIVGQATTLGISPDARHVVQRHGKSLAIRSLDDFALTDVPGTEFAYSPTFSPDGTRLAFVTNTGALRVVPLGGGPLTDIPRVHGSGLPLYWGEDNKIYYSAGLGTGGIWRVTPAGGEPERVTQVEDREGENAHSNPQLLPGGNILLYTALGPSGDSQDSRIIAQVIGSPKRKVLVDKAICGRYLSSGHLLYAKNDGTIFAVPFDLAKLAMTGEPVAVLSNIQTAAWGGGAFLAISADGTLAFLQRSDRPQFVFRTMDSTEHSINGDIKIDASVLARTGFASVPVEVSHDGQRLALNGRAPGTHDIWIIDRRGEPERLTFDPAENERPVWSPDDRFIAYSSAQTATTRRILVKSVGSGEPPRLVRTWPRHIHLTSWSPDGQWFTAYEYTPTNSLDVWAISTDGKKEIPIATGPAGELNPQFSPDGKWIAYQSNETGRSEIYVVPFPSLASRKQVSSDGGAIPRWDPRGRTLYYLQNGYLVAQEVSTGKEFEKGEIKRLFATDAIDFGILGGNHFILTQMNTEPDNSPIYLIVNWFSELKAKFRK